MNYIAYPIVDLKTKDVTDVLYFIDSDLQKNRKLLVDLDRESYFKYLENDYNKRMIELYGDESGLFG